jgi:hypothetical protein
MTQLKWQQIEQFLLPLCEQGLFLSIFGWNDPTTLVIDCALYFTDTDEQGNPSGLFSVDSVEKLQAAKGDQKRCICCEQLCELTEYRRGSIICPICLSWTPPHTLRQRKFRGLFHFVLGEPPRFIAPAGGDEYLPKQMTNQEQIQAITKALSMIPVGTY